MIELARAPFSAAPRGTSVPGAGEAGRVVADNTIAGSGRRADGARGEIDTIGVCRGQNPHHVDLTRGATAPLPLWLARDPHAAARDVSEERS